MSTRERYSAEFKREAIELVPRPGDSCWQVALEIGDGPNLLTRLVREAAPARGSKAFTGPGGCRATRRLPSSGASLRASPWRGNFCAARRHSFGRWSMHHRQDREMEIRTAEIAHWHRRRTTAVILRSDCGCQFTSVAYQRFLAHKAHNLLISSMNAVEHCGDNASCEGFLGILKWKCVLRSSSAALDATRVDLFD